MTSEISETFKLPASTVCSSVILSFQFLQHSRFLHTASSLPVPAPSPVSHLLEDTLAPFQRTVLGDQNFVQIEYKMALQEGTRRVIKLRLYLTNSLRGGRCGCSGPSFGPFPSPVPSSSQERCALDVRTVCGMVNEQARCSLRIAYHAGSGSGTNPNIAATYTNELNVIFIFIRCGLSCLRPGWRNGVYYLQK